MIASRLPEELSILRETLGAFLRAHYDDEVSKRCAESGPGWSLSMWDIFANDLGLLGAGIDEDLGGAGGGAAANAIIMETFGRALVLEPFLSTAVLGVRFLSETQNPAARALVAPLIEGKVRIAFAHAEPGARDCPTHVETRAIVGESSIRLIGHKIVVPDAASATHFIVTARCDGDAQDPSGLCVFLVPVDAEGLRKRDYRLLSGRCASDLNLEEVNVAPSAALTKLGAANLIIEHALDEAAACLCAEAIGVLSRLVDESAAYLSQRRQFGVAIGSFQALQHRMSDMLIHLTLAQAITNKAIEALSQPRRTRARAVSAAKVYVSKACRYIGQNAVQLHGGMGITDELVIGRLFKRAFEIERQFGSRAYHLRRFDALRDDQEARFSAGV